MKIRNEKAFSEDEIKAIRLYYSWLIKAKEKEYEENLDDLENLEYLYVKNQFKINLVDSILKFMRKHKNNKAIMFVFNDLGLTEDFFEEYLDIKLDERDYLVEQSNEKQEFITLYENLVNNGLVIKKNNSFMYDVMPYDGEPYINFEDDALNNSNVFELTRK